MTRSSQQSAHRRRASGYLIVLGAATMLTIIGVSALLAVRVEARTVMLTENTIKARIAADSVLDVALRKMVSDPYWRSRFQHKVWSSDIDLDGTTAAFMFFDEVDGDLSNDDNQAVRVYAKATSGEAVRAGSLLVDVHTTGGGGLNLLSNAGIEEGTAWWMTAGDCQLDTDNSYPFSGSRCLRVKNREHPGAAVFQNVPASLTNGGVFQVQAWVRTKNSSESVTLGLYVRTDSGQQIFTLKSGTVHTYWTKLSGEVTLNWNGNLQDAYWGANTASTSQDFYLDEVSFVDTAGESITVTPAPGSWRREVGL